MSARLVDRAAGLLSKRLDRRGFVSRAAMVGSAAVVAPATFALTPTSAYAAVCRCSGSNCVCGSLCCDGYTEFCCTLHGANACPAGTVAAGWWKVDGSQFCGGAARYYLDCNAQCNGCGCAGGDCNHRKSGCPKFRYGQCHQEMPCVGPIVCRVVTCTPPWLYDPSCTTSVRTDNATRDHHRPCLDQPIGALDSVTDSGGAVRVQGWALDQTDQTPTRIDAYIDGRLTASVITNVARPDVSNVYPYSIRTQGFDFRVAADSGQRLVCVYAVDLQTGKATLLGLNVMDVLPYGGAVDVLTASNGRIVAGGWAMDSRVGTGSVYVRITVDGRTVADVRANRDRPDVAAVYPAAGPAHGFSAGVNVPPGRHEVCVTMLASDGSQVPMACKQLVA
jgi:hypothetical protein